MIDPFLWMRRHGCLGGFALVVERCLKTRRVAVVMMAIIAAAAPAALAGGPDWPCTQDKPTTLSLGQDWAGPSIDPYLATWSGDADVADLARHLSQRRLAPEQAERAVRAFADAAGAQRRERLLALEAGVFTTLAAEHAAVMDGLDRYARRQQELAAEVRTDLEALRAAEATDPSQAQALRQKVEWETRLFEQRRQSISFACDVPSRIEQRLLTLSNIVQPLVD